MIVRTKLTIPHMRGGLILRPRLMRLLNEGRDARLTLVSGQAGYGKTTALGQWARSAGLPVAWFSLDRQDSDWVQFWSGVTAALGTVLPDFGQSAQTLIQDGPSSAPAGATLSAEPAIKTLLNELSEADTPLALVIDDYQFIELPAIHRSFAYFIECLPPSVHLYVASRTEPAFPTARLLARGELRRVTADDLRFGPDEGRTYFADKPGLALTPEQAASLVRQTEGWISGMQLAAISLSRGPDPAAFIRQFSGRQHEVADYLLEEVVRELDEPLRRFMYETSVLTRMNRALCEAVTGADDAQVQLAKLEQLNLFLIPLDGERQWYRYHHLLSDFLRSRFQEREPQRRADAHARAARWLEDNSFVEEAGEHYLAGGQYDDAARLIEQHLPDLIRSRISTLSRWVLRLPTDSLRTRPMAELFYLLVQIGSGERGTAVRLIAEARDRYEAMQHTMDETAWKIIMGNLYFLSASAAFLIKDLESITFYFERADRLYPEGRLLRTISYNNNHGRDEFDDRLGYLNDYHGSDRFMQRWLGDWGHNLAHPFVATLYASNGQLLYEWDRLAEAEACLERVLSRTDTPDVARSLMQLYTCAAHVQQALGRPAAAADLLLQLRSRIESPDHDLYMRRIDAELAELQLRQGAADRADQWAERCGLSAADEPTLPGTNEYLTLTRVLTACGRAEEAAALAERLYALQCKEDRLRDRIRALLALGLALHRLGRIAEALGRLDTALRLAEPQGFVRSFVDEGAGMATLLAAYVAAKTASRPRPGSDGAAAYAARLLARMTGSAPGAGRPADAGTEARAGRRLKVSCFGRFKVCAEDGAEIRWRTSKAEELMAYLVHHRGEAVDRYRIMDALWDDDSARTAANLNTTVHILRRTLSGAGVEGIVRHNRGFYRIDTSALDCDYLMFERFISSGEPSERNDLEACAAVAGLYTDHYLADNGYSWCGPHSKSLEHEFIALQLAIADRYIERGDPRAAIPFAKKALKLAPWREDAHVRLIRAYWSGQDRIAALKQYDALKRMLQAEYRMEPGEEVRALLGIRQGNDKLRPFLKDESSSK